MHALIRKLKNMSYIHIISIILAGLAFAGSLYFVDHNQSLYDRPIAEVENVKIINSNDMEDMNGNKDRLYTQQITAQIKNGEHEGEKILLKNEYSSSGAYDQPYKPGNEVFVTIDKDGKDSGALTGGIEDVKRDKFLMLISWVFILLILVVGKKQGLFSLVTLAVNAVVLSYGLDVYIQTDGTSLLLVCSVGVIIFTAVSLLFVNGFNEKTYAAAVSTLITTFITLLISYAVVKLTGGSGLRYEEMQFLTRPYEAVFLAGILIGCLGAVMDVAITLSSSIFGLYEKNQGISIKALTKSGFEIGRDIMGTMTNILFFVYISGAIPMLILYFKNASPLGFTLTMNLSLETARALSGGIGIVLTIPIAIFISIFFVKRKKAKL
ncbi:YibE/F family protein [Rossellomorea aquimaris]|uniref:YibE/F-like family protein n=1 Tax=Rossellomorea aquimaris TaxID=189382 RepID=A0A1J6WKW0_9BACI|nr:YibE/F family protein [Rossellomorea aquimaris]OIU68615.1 yibE/F-like family protein [Rossellomorea aquimaris]